jgi:hypothetical protein
MATPLDPTPPKHTSRLARVSSRARAVVSAGIGVLALAGAVLSTPGAALAQGGELEAANQWVTDQIQAPAAWETTKGEGATVAVIDSGISEHPFFEGKNIERGYSVFSKEEDAWNDQDGHGTAVAAMVLSVAPEATLLPVRSGTGADLAEQGLTGGAEGGQVESIRWAVDNGADAIVMSWGIAGSDPSSHFLEVMQYAVDRGVVLLAAAGNDPNQEMGYPAEIPGVVAVSGTDENGQAWPMNSTGPEVAIAAPASPMTIPVVQEETLGWGDSADQELYRMQDGTSLSTGLVGGVVALMLSSNPELDGNNAIQRLIQTAGDGDNRTEETGFGLVNANQAVHAEDIEAVTENPLGYPLGEPGLSGAETDGEGTGEEEPGASDDGVEKPGEPSAAAAEKSGTGISTVIIVAAAVVLIGAAITVWLVLRGRSRRQPPSASPLGSFGGEHGSTQGGYPQAGANSPQYGPPPDGGQNFGSPPPGGQQHYSPPMNQGESSPPWGPGHDPNQHR